MTAAIANRDTVKKQITTRGGAKVKGATTIFAGTLIALTAGFAAPGSAALGLYALGRSASKVVNAGADGDTTVDYEPGIYRWANGDAIARADVGKRAFIVDDQTVSKDGVGKSLAGIIIDVDADGVWVWTSPEAIALAAAMVSVASVQFVAPVALVAGDVAIAAGVTVTPSSIIVPIRSSPDVVAAHWGDLSITTRVNGGPGTGGFHIHSSSATDVSTVAALIIG
jgi:hypothetical protein